MINLHDAVKGAMNGRKFTKKESDYLESMGCDMVDVTVIGDTDSHYLMSSAPEGYIMPLDKESSK